MSDQLDVLLRAGRPSPPAPSAGAVYRARAAAMEAVSGLRVRRRTRYALVAAAAAIGALLVSPVGFGNDIARLLTGTPAPPAVKESFAGQDRTNAKFFAAAQAAGRVLQDRYSQVLADQAVGVISIKTVDGPVDLWAAPTADGRQCWLIQTGEDQATGRPHGLGSCDGLERTPAILPDLFWTDGRPNVNLVHIRVYDAQITSVEVDVENGSDVTLPVTEGHALGWIPKLARLAGATGLDAQGDVVARWSR